MRRPPFGRLAAQNQPSVHKGDAHVASGAPMTGVVGVRLLSHAMRDSRVNANGVVTTLGPYGGHAELVIDLTGLQSKLVLDR